VLKGPTSALNGSEAVGGVIHINTKVFAAKETARKKAQAQKTVGEFDLLNANVGGYFSNGRTSMSGGFLSNNTTGQQQRGIKGYVHLNTASASLSHKWNDHWQVAFRSALDNRKFAAQNFYTTFASDTAEEQVKTFWNQLKAIYQKGQNKITLDVGYKWAEDEYLFNKSSVPNLNKSRLWQALAVYQHTFTEKTNVHSGLQFINRSIRSNDRGNHTVAQAAAFVILNQLIGTSLNVSPALRIDWNERSGTEVVPQVALSYFILGFQFRTSAGKTIRDADFTERFNNYNKSTVSSGRIGNPDLQAERSFSYEAGADYFASKGLKLSATFFQRFHKRLIDWVSTPYMDMPRKNNLIPTGSYALAKNIAEVTTTGFETDLQYSYSFMDRYQLWSTLGLVWLHSKSSEPVPSFYITSHARFLTNFSLLLAAPHFQISTNGVYKTREEQAASAINTKVSKDYFVMNTKGEVLFWQKRLGIFLQVDNIFDKKYSDLLGAIMPRRWWQGGARLTL
ncbi:MAG: TonB-dependent receptor, partial [Flavisolibacter sp.]|nr:TonB-dependent receptor [Flavisolibacter sp.]